QHPRRELEFMTKKRAHRDCGRRPQTTRLAASLFAVCLIGSGPVAARPDDPEVIGRLVRMSLEELGEVRVTSVTRRESRLNASPASLYVITAEDIRRSGATTLPEVLRRAPNLQAAMQTSVSYAISARGFNNAVG